MTRTRAWGLGALTLSGVYLYTFPTATIPYFGIELAHILGGLLFGFVVLGALLRMRGETSAAKLGWLAIGLGTALGVALTFTGATRPLRPLLYSHIFLCAAGVLFLVTAYAANHNWAIRSTGLRFTAFLLVAVTMGTSAWAKREIDWINSNRITNPAMPPASQDGEGQGINGDFFPS